MQSRDVKKGWGSEGFGVDFLNSFSVSAPTTFSPRRLHINLPCLTPSTPKHALPFLPCVVGSLNGVSREKGSRRGWGRVAAPKNRCRPTGDERGSSRLLACLDGVGRLLSWSSLQLCLVVKHGCAWFCCVCKAVAWRTCVGAKVSQWGWVGGIKRTERPYVAVSVLLPSSPIPSRLT